MSMLAVAQDASEKKASQEAEKTRREFIEAGFREVKVGENSSVLVRPLSNELVAANKMIAGRVPGKTFLPNQEHDKKSTRG